LNVKLTSTDSESSHIDLQVLTQNLILI